MPSSESGAMDEFESQGKASKTAQAAEGRDLPADLAAAYQQLQIEKQELTDRLLRKQAELENFRKRMQREKEDFLQHANVDLIRALLPTLDGFERALK
ncbi:MAG: nucleotide exchange factor GrpE, partial [Terriglobia bacterium]